MKNSILFILLLGAFYFTNESNAQCFSSDFTDAVTENLCSGDTPSLPEEGIDFNLTGDLSTQVGGLVWSTGFNPDVDPVYNLTVVDQVGCDPSPITTVYAFVQCDNGTTSLWIEVANHSFQVYPEIQVPTLSGPNIDINGNCTYNITPACSNDMLSTSGFIIPPGSAEGTQLVDVQNINNPCGISTFDIDYGSCTPSCLTVVYNPITEVRDVCEGAVLDLLDLQNTVLTDLDGSAIYTWTDQNGIEINPPIDNIPLTHTGDCQVETLIYELRIDCVSDPALALFGGTVTVNLYPTITASMYELPDLETCTVAITDLCTQGSLEILYSIDGGLSFTSIPPPISPGETVPVIDWINIEGAPEECGLLIGPTTVSCPAEDCLISDFSTAIVESICDGDIPIMFPQEGIDFTITDDGGTQIGDVAWYTGDNPDNDAVYDGAALLHSGTDNCAADGILSFYAFAQCDIDADGVFDIWVQVAQHNVIVYPSAQEPSLVGPTVNPDSGNCTYTLEPACPNDQLTASGFDSDSATETTTLYVSVSQNNACFSFNADFVFEACEAPICGGIIELVHTENACSNSIASDTSLLNIFGCELQDITVYNPVLLPYYGYDTIASCLFVGNDTLLLGLNAAGCDSVLITTYLESSSVILPTIFVDICNVIVPNDTMLFTTSGCDSIQVIVYNTVNTSLSFATIPSCELSGVDTTFYISPSGCDSIVVTEYVLPEDPIILTNLIDTCDVVIPEDTIILSGQGIACDTQMITIYNTFYSSSSFSTAISCELAGTTVSNTFTNAVGCDSIANIEYISESITDSIWVDTCEVVLPMNNVVYTNQAGCDSIVVFQYNTLTASTWYEDLDGDGWGDPLIDSLDCEQPAGYVEDTLEQPTGLFSNIQLTSLVDCYPNPNKGAFWVEALDIDRASVHLYNQVGETIAFDSEIIGTKMQFKIKDPMVGVYFLNLQTLIGERHCLKVIVVN